MRRLRLALALLLFLLSPAAAQTPAPSKAEVESLIGTLENEAERTKLIGQLRLMITAQDPQPAAAESPVGELSQQIGRAHV